MSKPIVAIVGRPNVGKSTLFNALAGGNISIVKDTPGVTRDRIYADVEWLNYSFTLIDTGGIEPDTSDVILAQMRDQAQIAIDTADVIIFITDVKQGLVDYLGSDCHGTHFRPLQITDTLKWMEKELEPELLHQLLVRNPENILKEER